MNKEFEKELVELLNKYYSTNWDYVWEFEADSIVTKLWLGEEEDDDHQEDDVAESALDEIRHHDGDLSTQKDEYERRTQQHRHQQQQSRA